MQYVINCKYLAGKSSNFEKFFALRVVDQYVYIKLLNYKCGCISKVEVVLLKLLLLLIRMKMWYESNPRLALHSPEDHVMDIFSSLWNGEELRQKS